MVREEQKQAGVQRGEREVGGGEREREREREGKRERGEALETLQVYS